MSTVFMQTLIHAHTLIWDAYFKSNIYITYYESIRYLKQRVFPSGFANNKMCIDILNVTSVTSSGEEFH